MLRLNFNEPIYNQFTSIYILSHFFYSNNKLPTSYHVSSSQMKRCKSHSDCPGGAAPVEKKGFCPFLLLFFFVLHPSSPLSLSLSLLLCPVLIFCKTNILIIILLIRLWPPKSSSSSSSLQRHQLFSLKLSQALSAAPMAGVGSHNIFKVSPSNSYISRTKWLRHKKVGLKLKIFART